MSLELLLRKRQAEHGDLRTESVEDRTIKGPGVMRLSGLDPERASYGLPRRHDGRHGVVEDDTVEKGAETNLDRFVGCERGSSASRGPSASPVRH